MRRRSGLRCPGARDRGVTILEVIVSLGMLVAITGALFALRGRDFQLLGESFRETAARRTAAARLEALTAGIVEIRPGVHAFDPDPETARPLPAVRGEEEIREAGPGLVSVEVRVSWDGPGGEERRLALSTLVLREEPR